MKFLFTFCSLLCMINTSFADTTKSVLPSKVTLTRGHTTQPYIEIEQYPNENLDFGLITLQSSQGVTVTMNSENGSLTSNNSNVILPSNSSRGHFKIKGYRITEETPISISFSSTNLVNSNGDIIVLKNIQSNELTQNNGSLSIPSVKPDESYSSIDFTTAGTIEIPAELPKGNYSGYYSINFTY